MAQKAFRADKLNGPAVYYDSLLHSKTFEGRFINGNREGKWTFYLAGTDKINTIERYKNGKMNGEFIGYDSATGVMLAKGNYENGNRDGKWRYYYKGTKALETECEYKNGNLDGKRTSYDRDGFASDVVEYKDGLREGEAKTYYGGSKKLWGQAFFIKDSLNGERKTYYPSGKLKRKERFDNGKILSANCYAEDGKEIDYYPFLIEPQYMLDELNYIANGLRYPDEAVLTGTEGVVYVGFVLNENGDVTKAEVLKGIGNGCDEEAVRVISQMRCWQPAYVDGMPWTYYKILPVTFKLPPKKDIKQPAVNKIVETN